MASQLMLMPPAQCKSDLRLTEAQSLAFVKIFLNASIACICHTRELLDWQSTCFKTRHIDQLQIDDEDAYVSFRENEPTSPGNSQEIRVLVRDGSSQADQLLDMIVSGSVSERHD
jgi:hypothetical protein